jgi:hypothetical protein
VVATPPPTPAELDALLALIAHLCARPPPAEAPGFGPLPAALVRRHLLAPLAHQAGCAGFRNDAVASGLLAELRERLAAEAVAALAAAGVPVILLKGASYAGHLYEDPALRPMTDLDLMVPAADHPRAIRALGACGYRPERKPGSRSALHHATTLRGPSTSVDLHRSMVQPLRSRVDLDGVWRRAHPATERTDGALRMELVDETLFHLVHLARHELLVSAVAYVDAARLFSRVAAAGAWAELAERAAAWRLGRAVGAAVAATVDLSGGAVTSSAPLPAPGTLGRRLLPSVREIAAGPPAPRGVQLVRKAWLLEGPRELLGLLAVAAHARLTSIGPR